MSRIAVACALILTGGALASSCGPAASPSATARRVSLVLAIIEAEHSKDSHTRTTTYRLEEGVLSATHAWSGYHPGRPPEPTETRVRLDDAEIGALIDHIRRSGLERSASSETGRLGGPGNEVTLELQVTLDGRSARSRSVDRRPWSDPAAEPGAVHAVLLALAGEMERLERRAR